MSLQDMFDALVARGPNSIVAQNADGFAKLIGSWSVEAFDADGDGAKRVNEGEWHFGWVLEGRAIQDVLITPLRAHRVRDMPTKGNRYATSLRIFDADAGIWRVFSIDPVGNLYLVMEVRHEGSRIVAEGTDLSGAAYRIVTSDMTQNSFAVREERSDGDEWTPVKELRAHRKS
jgi:hypothetical protein